MTSFKNTPGVYFEQLRNVKQVTAKWTVVVYFDLTPYKHQIQLLHDGISSLQKLCDNTSNNSSCTYLLNFFDKSITELEKEMSIFSLKRTRRGALDIVENVANSLFGVLYSYYAAAMSKTINDLKADDKTLEKLLKNQTSLIDSTINVIKRQQLNSQAKDEIDSQIHELLFEKKVPMKEVQVEQHILMLSMQMLILESHLRQIQLSIMEVMADSHHGKINPLLLTPDQLNDDILKVKIHLPSGYELPFTQNNIVDAYKLVNIKGTMATDHENRSVD